MSDKVIKCVVSGEVAKTVVIPVLVDFSVKECSFAVSVVTFEDVATVELIVGVITVNWWLGVDGDMEDCLFVVLPAVGDEGCPLEVGIVITGGSVIALVGHFLSGESNVGDGALTELRLHGKPKNETKAIYDLFVVVEICHHFSLHNGAVFNKDKETEYNGIFLMFLLAFFLKSVFLLLLT